MAAHLWVTASCAYLWILRTFSDHLFYNAPMGNCLFHSQVLFKHFIQEEVAIWRLSCTWNTWKLSVKKLICNEVERCQPASLRKNLFHTFSFMLLSSFSQNTHDYFFPEETLKVCEHNFFQVIKSGSKNLPFQLRFI